MASNDEQRSATTILTTAAQSIAARLIANETTAKFTKAEISTTNLFNQSVTELQVLTSLDNVQQTADINTVTVINNNTVNVNVAIDQTKAPNNYQMNSVGLFAVDGDGKEVLYSVTVLKDPVYIHQDAMGSALGIDLETVVGQASNVEISVNPAGAVTNEILKAALADYVKADDSTVVHTTDMRKPASDVAGIEEVNAKQDKIGYTPADDSKVVHDNKDNTIQVNGTQVSPYNKLTDSAGGRNLLPVSNYNSGYVNGADGTIVPADAIAKEVISNFIPVDTTQSYYCQIVQQVNANQAWWGIGFYDANKQFISCPSTGNTTVTGTITSVIRMLPFGSPNVSIPNVSTIVFPKNTAYVRISFRTYGAPIQASLEKTSILNDWTPAPEDKADDSKVAHLSGANNFDTVPTVNNNPLLLASSLPSDLARTGQDANFTGKLQKSGVDVATVDDVSAKQDKLDYTPANAANVVDRNPDTGVVSTPTDFTKLTVNGGKSVATSDDLKSLEASAWRELNFDVSQENYKAFSAAKIVYKINRDEKYISFFFAGTPSHVGNTSYNSTLVTDTISLVMDLSSVLTEISGINFETEYGQISDNNSHAASLGYAGAKVVFTSQVFIPNYLVGVTFLPKDYPDCRIYYTSLVNGI
ncbi:hypothetical protein NE303_02690 [Levilactobacillus brevis]|uniref:hypothetical protein n=1 Tax=Levilactobacillus brevis TaxID=1580 RepID=UPI0020736BCE|nr:hypothetical protein [Levilactobacillus brevis]MCM6801942.1 hypothetical protein [Levilactobacillus brevis]MCM6804970.1 hypothetical protein [Levilactobacillus brevis]MCM6807402.1 hypothetical protein [Levilactobacillus brevis]MCM6813284.1 hypothetical protein [Levilactobacillus brevis]